MPAPSTIVILDDEPERFRTMTESRNRTTSKARSQSCCAIGCADELCLPLANPVVGVPMYQIVWFVAIVILLLAWIAMEMRGQAGARVMLGLAVMACIGLSWFFTDLRMVQLDAYHQALFRQMDTAPGGWRH